MSVGVVLVVKKSVRYLYACLRYVLSGCLWSGISSICTSWVVFRSVWYGRSVCPLVSWSGSDGVAEMLSKFRKLRNFITKFGSFGDKAKSDFNIWWLGSKAVTLLATTVSIAATPFGPIEDVEERRYWMLVA